MNRPAARIVVSLSVLLVGMLGVTRYVARPWAVGGRSMEPALYHGDRVLVDRWTFRHRPPRVGEVVLLAGPGSVPIVKRVGRFDSDPTGARGLWVVGDNPALSEDSRSFGPVPLEGVRGRVVFRYWPLTRMGPVR